MIACRSSLATRRQPVQLMSLQLSLVPCRRCINTATTSECVFIRETSFARKWNVLYVVTGILLAVFLRGVTFLRGVEV